MGMIYAAQTLWAMTKLHGVYWRVQSRALAQKIGKGGISVLAKGKFVGNHRGGKPDRFVNQYEAFGILVGDPLMALAGPMPNPGNG